MIHKETGFVRRVKFDAVNLQGIWPNFPTGKGPHGHGRTYAGRYLLMAELQRLEEEFSSAGRLQDDRFKAKELLDRMFKRLEEEESTALTLFLADV
jgi:hypothetical protein